MATRSPQITAVRSGKRSACSQHKLEQRAAVGRLHVLLSVRGDTIWAGSVVLRKGTPISPVAIILNILWLATGGIAAAFGWLIAAVIMAITIIGLPWSFAAFRIAWYTLLPFGQEMRSTPNAGVLSMLGNIIWFVLAGWWLALGPPAPGRGAGDHDHRPAVRLGASEAGRGQPVPGRQGDRAARHAANLVDGAAGLGPRPQTDFPASREIFRHGAAAVRFANCTSGLPGNSRERSREFSPGEQGIFPRLAGNAQGFLDQSPPGAPMPTCSISPSQYQMGMRQFAGGLKPRCANSSSNLQASRSVFLDRSPERRGTSVERQGD